MAAHLHWRVRLGSKSGSSTAYTLHTLSFRNSSGVALSLTGGTAIADSGTPANAFDGSSGTTWVAGDTSNNHHWLGYTFSTAVEPAQVVISIGSLTAGAPVDFLVQWSDDASTWVDYAVLKATTWTASTPQTFDIAAGATALQIGQDGADDAHAHWRIWLLGVQAVSTNPQLATLRLYDAAGGAGTELTATATNGGTGTSPLNAFDGSTATSWTGSGNVNSNYLSSALASPANVASVMMRTISGSANGAPTQFYLQWSDNGSTWYTAEMCVQTGWGASTDRTFNRTVSAYAGAPVVGGTTYDVAGADTLSTSEAAALRATPERVSGGDTLTPSEASGALITNRPAAGADALTLTEAAASSVVTAMAAADTLTPAEAAASSFAGVTHSVSGADTLTPSEFSHSPRTYDEAAADTLAAVERASPGHNPPVLFRMFEASGTWSAADEPNPDAVGEFADLWAWGGGGAGGNDPRFEPRVSGGAGGTFVYRRNVRIRDAVTGAPLTVAWTVPPVAMPGWPSDAVPAARGDHGGTTTVDVDGTPTLAAPGGNGGYGTLFYGQGGLAPMAVGSATGRLGDNYDIGRSSAMLGAADNARWQALGSGGASGTPNSLSGMHQQVPALAGRARATSSTPWGVTTPDAPWPIPGSVFHDPDHIAGTNGPAPEVEYPQGSLWGGAGGGPWQAGFFPGGGGGAFAPGAPGAVMILFRATVRGDGADALVPAELAQGMPRRGAEDALDPAEEAASVIAKAGVATDALLPAERARARATMHASAADTLAPTELAAGGAPGGWTPGPPPGGGTPGGGGPGGGPGSPWTGGTCPPASWTGGACPPGTWTPSKPKP